MKPTLSIVEVIVTIIQATNIIIKDNLEKVNSEDDDSDIIKSDIITMKHTMQKLPAGSIYIPYKDLGPYSF